MSYYRSQSHAQLLDSKTHGTNSELYIVEGESAAQSIAHLRDVRVQAVLPLQGKPINAWRSNEARILASPLFQQIAAALGIASPIHMEPSELQAMRFGRIYLLFDPDADGIHIGALVLLYFQRYLPLLLTEGRVLMLRAPSFSLEFLTDSDTGEIQQQYAYTPAQAQALQQHATARGWQLHQQQVFRGIGGLPSELLRETCITPATRKADTVTAREIQAVIDVFGGTTGSGTGA